MNFYEIKRATFSVRDVEVIVLEKFRLLLNQLAPVLLKLAVVAVPTNIN